jgi:hypothetical protein
VSHPAYSLERIQYRVPGSKPDTEYVVLADTRDGRIASCSCPHFRYRGAVCKHMRQVEAGGIRPVVRIRPQAPAPRIGTLNDLYPVL